MEENKKPKIFLFLKIIGIIGLIIGIVITIIGAAAFAQTVTGINMLFVGSVISMLSLVALITGFKPEFSRIQAKTTKYITKLNKDEYKDIANTGANISSEALTSVASSIKKGLKDTSFCKHCGETIETDSKFCKKCGKEQ